ncbi:MAG: alpha-N-acetylglucosaminidase [Tannerella sp.]|jgi:alpha-N-acetylglucosaminidase|nr:alpha-N-acetylglucosaminidase [Tannerella sp.]
MKIQYLILLLSLSVNLSAASEKQAKQSAIEMIQRIIPDKASCFKVEIISRKEGKDCFEIETKGDKIILRGNNGVSVASALNHYLKYYCNAQISWNGDNMKLPGKLPVIPQKVSEFTAFDQRVYLNYCTFSYTMPWWDWNRWEREIDWMAMHGINMPLSVVGQEAVWQNTLRKFKMTDEEIRTFLVGPAFQAWQWMTNIETYGGPLPQSWIDSHLILGQQILKRQRELGMTPILQSFTGFVPAKLKEKYPDAPIKEKNRWCNAFTATVQLDPLDPLFREMGTVFLEEQEKLFGTDHIYAADPFHEGAAPSNEREYLEAVGKVIWQVASGYDPDAVIAMQTWSLREAIARTFPEDRLLLLDLGGWNVKRFDSFWGYPYVAGTLHNYGGRVYMGGNLPFYGSNAHQLMSDPANGRITGIGLFPEAIEHNPVVYELATEIAWMEKAPILKEWIRQYAHARYGKLPASIDKGWEILQETVYSEKAARLPSVESVMCARPALTIKKVAANGDLSRPYDAKQLWDVVELFLQASGELKGSDTYCFDLVDIMRQCMSDLSLPLQKEMSDAYLSENDPLLEETSDRFLDLIDDFDRLLGTRSTFLLGKWIKDARKWGVTEEEKDLYEWNARTLVTVWGPKWTTAHLFEYSNRQWSGLMKGYYKVRWEKFISYLKAQPKGEWRYDENYIRKSLADRPAQDASDFYTRLTNWEYDWSFQKEEYSSVPSGDEIEIVRELYHKWKPVMIAVTK